MSSSSKLDVPRVLEMAESMRLRGLENLQLYGHLVPVAAIFGRRHMDNGRPHNSLLFCTMSGNVGDPDVRDEFAAKVRDFAVKTDAFAVLYMMEMYMLEMRRPAEVPHGEFVNDVRDNAVPSEHPDRISAVWAQLEHEDLFGLAVWIARCPEDAKGRTVPGVFEQLSDGTATDSTGLTGIEGRFVGLLPRRGGITA